MGFLKEETKALDIMLRSRTDMLSSLAWSFEKDRNVQHAIESVLAGKEMYDRPPYEWFRDEVREIASFLGKFMHAFAEAFDDAKENDLKAFISSSINFRDDIGKEIIAPKIFLLYSPFRILSRYLKMKETYDECRVSPWFAQEGSFLWEKIRNKVENMDADPNTAAKFFLSNCDSYKKWLGKLEERYLQEKELVETDYEKMIEKISKMSDREKFEAGIAIFQEFYRRKRKSEDELVQGFQKMAEVIADPYEKEGK